MPNAGGERPKTVYRSGYPGWNYDSYFGDSGLGQYFTASSTVAIYKPGDEATQYETRTIASITTGTSYDTITLSSALSAVTAAAGIVITYPDSGSASVAQLRYMYEKATYFWR